MISAEVAQGIMVYHWTLTLSVYIQVPYHSVIHINEFKSALTTSFILIFFRRCHINWPIIKKIWNIGHSPIESTLWTPITKQKQMCTLQPTVLVELCANHMG
jgi:hypothetical protein